VVVAGALVERRREHLFSLGDDRADVRVRRRVPFLALGERAQHHLRVDVVRCLLGRLSGAHGVR
jgi:hypothetical protein